MSNTTKQPFELEHPDIENTIRYLLSENAFHKEYIISCILDDVEEEYKFKAENK